MKTLADSTYHHMLRISMVVVATVLVFDSGLVFDGTRPLSKLTQHYVASVIGVEATVKPNELNLYTAALTKKEEELNSRERALAEREIEVTLNSGTSANTNNTSTYLLSTVLFIILVLVILNYILDYLRARDSAAFKQYGQPT